MLKWYVCTFWDYALICRWAACLCEWRFHPAILQSAPQYNLQRLHCPLMANTGNTFPGWKGHLFIFFHLRHTFSCKNFRADHKKSYLINMKWKIPLIQIKIGLSKRTCSLSLSSVSITIEWHLHSHTILQKSSTVWDKGPWVAIK